MGKITGKIAAAALLSLGAGVASASSFDFFLAGHGGWADSYEFETNGLTLTVTAGSFKHGFSGSYSEQHDEAGNTVKGYITEGNDYDENAKVGQYSHGLGVTNNTYGCYTYYTCTTDNKHTVDGSYWDDFLVLSFSQDVQLTSADFAYFGHYDDFRLFYDLNGDGMLGDDDFLTYKKDEDPFFDFPVVSTSLIGFAATGSHDSWKLKSVHGHISAVPLPATGLMLLAAVGAIGLSRRRRKA